AYKLLQRDLIRRKGELAESRMLVERLRRDLAEAQAAAQTSAGKTDGAESSLALERAVRQLTAEQRKLVHLLERRAAAPSAPAPSPEVERLAAAMDEMRRQHAAGGEERKREAAALTKRLEGLAAEVRTVRSPESAAPAQKARRAKPRGAAERVGIFVD